MRSIATTEELPIGNIRDNTERQSNFSSLNLKAEATSVEWVGVIIEEEEKGIWR